MPFYGRDLVPFRTHANHSADWFEANEVMGPKGLLEMPQKRRIDNLSSSANPPCFI